MSWFQEDLVQRVAAIPAQELTQGRGRDALLWHGLLTVPLSA